jgi:DNA-binding GntR family transcriptional regulator
MRNLSTVKAAKVLIPRPSLHAQVVETLREMIVETQLVPGERIDEKNLCQVFGISRTPLREALKVLASEGLVDLLPNRSSRVTPLTQENVGELFEVLSWLDFQAGQLAARRATEKDIAALRNIHERMMRHHRAGERVSYFRLNRELHTKIVEVAGNSVLSGIYANLMAQAQRARFIAIQSQDHWDRGVQEHEAIIEVLAASDGPRLGQLLMEHVQETGRMVEMSFVPAESKSA